MILRPNRFSYHLPDWAQRAFGSEKCRDSQSPAPTAERFLSVGSYTCVHFSAGHPEPERPCPGPGSRKLLANAPPRKTRYHHHRSTHCVRRPAFWTGFFSPQGPGIIIFRAWVQSDLRSEHADIYTVLGPCTFALTCHHPVGISPGRRGWRGVVAVVE